MHPAEDSGGCPEMVGVLGISQERGSVLDCIGGSSFWGHSKVGGRSRGRDPDGDTLAVARTRAVTTGRRQEQACSLQEVELVGLGEGLESSPSFSELSNRWQHPSWGERIGGQPQL